MYRDGRDRAQLSKRRVGARAPETLTKRGERMLMGLQSQCGARLDSKLDRTPI